MKRYVVQFPHPSQEHRVPGNSGTMAWNTNSHARKFLTAPGRARLEDDSEIEDELIFWGEWESESNYRRLSRNPPPGQPTVLHDPFWIDPEDGPFRQNTDPYVFGDCFRYSNCKQSLAGRASWLQSMAPGSVVLFGGSTHDRFFIDTVLVVSARTPWSRHATEEVTDPILRRVTCDSVRTDPNPLPEFTLYEGATPQAAIDGMFSFAPCLRRAEHPQGFVRPFIELHGIVNSRSRQAPKGTVVSTAQAIAAWSSVRDQVLAEGLLLGTHFATPPQRSREIGFTN